MRLADLEELLLARCPAPPRAAEFGAGYCSDLLSDVMAHAGPGSVLVTIQAHRNSVAVASLVGMAALVLCNGREAPPDMVEAARAEGLGIYETGLSQFEFSGRLWSALRAEEAAGAPSAPRAGSR